MPLASGVPPSSATMIVWMRDAQPAKMAPPVTTVAAMTTKKPS
jgi:hypothetical protein